MKPIKPLVLARYCSVRWWLGTFLIIEGWLGSSAAAVNPWINYEKRLGEAWAPVRVFTGKQGAFTQICMSCAAGPRRFQGGREILLIRHVGVSCFQAFDLNIRPRLVLCLFLLLFVLSLLINLLDNFICSIEDSPSRRATC